MYLKVFNSMVIVKERYIIQIQCKYNVSFYIVFILKQIKQINKEQ